MIPRNAESNVETEPTQEVSPSIERVNEELLSGFDALRNHLNSKASNAKILSKLQDYCCLLRCEHDIRSTVYDKIDPLYSARHELVKNKIIDAISDRFGDLVTIKSEYRITNGKLDIALLPPLVLKFDTKIIGIEVKSGNRVDAKTLNQIQRYLINVDRLMVVRVPTEDVVIIDRTSINHTLIKDLKNLTRKVDRIISGNLLIVEGQWCAGCNAKCEFRKPPRWSDTRFPSFEGFEKFVRNVDRVVDKVIAILEKEFSVQKGKILEEKFSYDTEREKENMDVNNGNGNSAVPSNKYQYM